MKILYTAASLSCPASSEHSYILLPIHVWCGESSHSPYWKCLYALYLKRKEEPLHGGLYQLSHLFWTFASYSLDRCLVWVEVSYPAAISTLVYVWLLAFHQYPTPKFPNSCYYSCYVTKSVKWRYLGNQAWYHRSAGVKTTGKILKKNGIFLNKKM